MDTQGAIAKLLHNLTKELLKVFSESVVGAVESIGRTGYARRPAESKPQASAPKRGRPRKNASKAVVSPPARIPGKATSKVTKSSPAEVDRLGERIVGVLGKSPRNLSVKEILANLTLSPADRGRFDYALGKLKDAKRVLQHGERGQARYGIGSGKARATRGPGRPRKSPSPEAKAADTADPSQSEVAPAPPAEA
jgi:hypothetical protein